MSVDGASYTTYVKEEIDHYRVVIGNQTCMFEKENDPTILRFVVKYFYVSVIYFMLLIIYYCAVSKSLIFKNT